MTQIRHIGFLLILVLLQWLLFNRLWIADLGFPMIYILFLLTLPGNIPARWEVVIGVAVGLIMDLICSSPGVHMGACALLSFLRPFALQSTMQDVERMTDTISSRNISFPTYTKMVCTLTCLHHTMVFLLDAGFCILNGWLCLLQILISSLFTCALLLGWEFIRRS